MLLHVTTNPLLGSLQNFAVWKTHTIVQVDLSKLCILRFPVIHVIHKKHCDVQTQNAFPRYLSCNTQLYIRRYANPHPSTSCMRQPEPWENSRPNLNNLDFFLLKTRRLLKLPLKTIWKCLCVSAPWLHSMEHKPTIQSSSMNFLELTRSRMSIFVPCTIFVTDALKY